MVPTSKMIDALAALKEFERHQLALANAHQGEVKGELELLLDGSSTTDGAVRQAESPPACEMFHREMRMSVEEHLRVANAEIERDWGQCGIDLKS
jgi:hypothetical protein